MPEIPVPVGTRLTRHALNRRVSAAEMPPLHTGLLSDTGRWASQGKTRGRRYRGGTDMP
ncbi:hypothetical protein TPA0910_44320 [Streptomyces hygroscopicus subsp. sporocinereus]|uniref:Uncharacterized protein n=1 Tax=Streptomyces hygroscopicus TaxID=1912 RepID=A0ABQ3U303_STRHY|nr:hypothetical protein TPA0910_44320 [Streptomyces hygroscopicus]